MTSTMTMTATSVPSAATQRRATSTMKTVTASSPVSSKHPRLYSIGEQLQQSLASKASATTNTPTPTTLAAAPALAQTPAPRPVTLAELALHRGENIHQSPSLPAWTCVAGHVFDITSFMAHHPGGSVVQIAAGIDATGLLESYHPSSSTRSVLAALQNKCAYVGPLVDYEAPTASGFFPEVQRRAEEAIRARGMTLTSLDTFSTAEAALTCLLFFACVIGACVYGSMWFAVALGVLTGRMGFLMHTGNHCSTSRAQWVNECVSWFMNIIGSSHTIWRWEHQVAHHLDPNELERDNDCEIANPLFRFHPDLPHHPIQAYQHIIVPIGISIGLIKWSLSDFVYFARGRITNVPFPVTRMQLFYFLVSKLPFFLVRIALPVYLFGWLHGLAMFVVPAVIGAHYLEQIFIVNHIQHGLVPEKSMHWSIKQVVATSNWKSGSVFWNWFSGGLNHQVEHHLFPSMNIYLYPYISAAVRDVCHEYGLPYHNYPSHTVAWLDMIRYLRALGQPDFSTAKFKSYMQSAEMER